MRIVACPSCHAQFDVTALEADRVRCHCGAEVLVGAPRAVEAEVRRCPGCGAPVEPRADSCGYCGSPLARPPRALSLVCPECCSRNPEDARHCTNCGVEFRPIPVEPAGPSLPCPGCGGALAPRAFGDVRGRECPDCHGLWLEADAFATLVRRAGAATAPAPSPGPAPPPRAREQDFTVRYRRCHACGGVMQRRNYGPRERRSGVILDWCGEHGLWLDADELECVVGFVAAGGLEPRGGAEVPDPGLGLRSLDPGPPSAARSWLSELLSRLAERR